MAGKVKGKIGFQLVGIWMGKKEYSGIYCVNSGMTILDENRKREQKRTKLSRQGERGTERSFIPS